MPGPQDWDGVDSPQFEEILVTGDQTVDLRNQSGRGQRGISLVSDSALPYVDLRMIFSPSEQLASPEDRFEELECSR